ncbi:molybdopterin-dependent oxidoreductase [Undibacterium sp. LX40W]|uniref:Molybdopterin-dependent oxidoreductase n=1 Tax=Undibacterium nitidum TaxID=2762298 RepID=A0A923KUP8_9BURK|nr:MULTISPECIES: nitrate reductase [Undibacterium]MBC3882437.1 molybdopterin-dependent oxidoreductase [Undibacterium nitidum]MBC3892718.1 molybdopterin-dependent oxidoreductase [Undibacterium sp. LX40W]
MHPTTQETKSTCCYCGVGCGVIIEHNDLEITGVRGDPEHPANFGKLCSKGSSLHLSAKRILQQQARVLAPHMRENRADALRESDWESCFEFVSERLAQCIQEHGPDSIGLYVSGQLLTEDYYLFNKLAKGLIGTNNIDSNSRLCMSSAVAAYRQSLGADAPPCCYEDIDQAEVILIAGSNTAYAHPILYRRIEEARRNRPQLKVIVVDPRRTDTAQEADLHLAIQPGTDVALFNGMLYLCLWEGWLDQEFIRSHTDGFTELKDLVRDFTPSMVAKTCGIREQDLLEATRWFATSNASLSLYCQGLNQSTAGTAKNSALINLHLATGHIGREGAGPFSLTGQPNAMGGRETGGMANLLSAHRDLNNAQHRAEVAELWGVDELPSTAGKTAVEMFNAARQGEIKILWIVCTNPAQSMPDQHLIREALERAELVIVQEAYRGTATMAYADVVFPAASWGEKSGTVTNSERRISRVRAALSPFAQAKPDWEIAKAVALKLARKLHRDKPYFDYADSEEIWNEHRQSTAGRDLDITGLSYGILDEQGPQQWPYPFGAQKGATRLYTTAQFATENGRAKFIPTAYIAPSEKVSARYPFLLNTGRLRDQWHGMSRTGTVAQLFAHAPEPSVQLAASDMQARFITEGDLIEISNARGKIILPANQSDSLHSGQVFIPMHWGQEFTGGHHLNQDQMSSEHLGVNALTTSAFDPSSKQPELKLAHVKINKIDLAWRFLAVTWISEEELLEVQQNLRQFYSDFSYASCTLFGRGEDAGIVFRGAHTETINADRFQALLQLLQIDSSDNLRYEDKARSASRHIRLQQNHNTRTIRSYALTGDISAESWLSPLLHTKEPIIQSAALLQKNASLGNLKSPASTIVCSCMNVSREKIQDALLNRSQIAIALAPSDKLKLLQNQLACGTNCGSCLPEVRKLIQQTPLAS